MSTRLTNILVLAIVLGSILAAVLVYPRLPEQVASHWNAAGEVDDYMSRFWGVAIFPIVVLAMYLLFLLIPRIDPLKENIAEFRGYFNGFILALVLFMAFIYALTLAWNLDAEFDMGRVIVPAVGVLFYIAGVLVSHARPNWFIGIRTPWTLSNEAVWNRTHRLGGRLFKLCGLLAILGVFLPGERAFWLVLGPALFVVVWSFVYSYWAYTRETSRIP